jgi:presenilin-like A22 family membrane protease
LDTLQRLLAQFTVIFLSTQIIGLYTGAAYLDFFRVNQEERAFEDPGNVGNSFYLFGYVLAGTVFLLLLIRFFKRDIIFKILEAIVIFTSSTVVFSVFLPFELMLFFSLALAILKFLKPTLILQNIASVVAVSGAGALLGSSLGVIPILTFMALLSVYDFISVFYTKHMVTLAKAVVSKKLSFTVAMPTKVHTFQLGTGDLFIPLMLSVSTLGSFGLAHALFVSLGALIGFYALFIYASKTPGRALPALPPICASCAIFLSLSLILL